MRCFNAAGHSDERNTVVSVCTFYLEYPVQDIVSKTYFFKSMSFSSYSTSRCHRSEDIHGVLLLSLLRLASAFFPANIHLIIVFQPVRVIYVSVYTYINLDRCFNSFYLIYFIKHIILNQRNQISSNLTFKYLYTNQISVFTRSFLN